MYELGCNFHVFIFEFAFMCKSLVSDWCYFVFKGVGDTFIGLLGMGSGDGKSALPVLGELRFL